MLNQETIELIWHCHREIKVGKQLLLDCEKIAAEQKDRRRLLGVSYTLAVSIIRAHLANKEAELAMLHERAKIEINTEEQKP